MPAKKKRGSTKPKSRAAIAKKKASRPRPSASAKKRSVTPALKRKKPVLPPRPRRATTTKSTRKTTAKPHRPGRRAPSKKTTRTVTKRAPRETKSAKVARLAHEALLAKRRRAYAAKVKAAETKRLAKNAAAQRRRFRKKFLGGLTEKQLAVPLTKLELLSSKRLQLVHRELDGSNREDWMILKAMKHGRDPRWKEYIDYAETLDIDPIEAADEWFSPSVR